MEYRDYYGCTVRLVSALRKNELSAEGVLLLLLLLGTSGVGLTLK